MPARIVYLSWPAGEITGGIKMVFRHVEGLLENGFDAAVATEDGRAPGWFETHASVIPLTALARDTDILVFPENHHRFLQMYRSWPNRKVIFCQNQFNVYLGLGGELSYSSFGAMSLLCCGWTVAAYCRRRFPRLKVAVVPNYVDAGVFSPPAKKDLQIAVMPKKRPHEVGFIFDLFRAEHPRLRQVPWVDISNFPEKEVARILGQSAVFLSLCRFEAFSLTLLEAMASGCVTAGFTGFGTRDYVDAQNGFWAQEDDLIECTEQLGRAVRLVTEGGPLLEHMVQHGLDTARYYNREKFVKALVSYWRNTLDTEAASL
jgi:glycosyltransferase involved in cell wall biosynthesis